VPIVQAWDMIENNEHLFDARDDEGFHNNRYHLAEMITYLGPPPTELLRRSPNTPRVFDEGGELEFSVRQSIADALLQEIGKAVLRWPHALSRTLRNASAARTRPRFYVSCAPC
jgi:hypothetical protein